MVWGSIAFLFFMGFLRAYSDKLREFGNLGRKGKRLGSRSFMFEVGVCGVPKIGVPFVGILTVRIVVFCGLYYGFLVYGNYHIVLRIYNGSCSSVPQGSAGFRSRMKVEHLSQSVHVGIEHIRV